MNKSILIKTLSYPLLIVGLVMIVLGMRWIIHPEPWLLDEVANVERLQIIFKNLPLLSHYKQILLIFYFYHAKDIY